MMENPKDSGSVQRTHELFVQLLEDIRNSDRGDELLGFESLTSTLDVHQRIYYVLGNVLNRSTRDPESERKHSWLN